MTTTIELNDIRLYAYHGCLDEEAQIGSEYTVDLTVQAEVSESFKTDNLNDTVDYVHLNRIVKEEMLQRAKLLEVVAYRIVSRVLSECPEVTEVCTRVSKINPPIGGDVNRVCIQICKKRF